MLNTYFMFIIQKQIILYNNENRTYKKQTVLYCTRNPIN